MVPTPPCSLDLPKSDDGGGGIFIFLVGKPKSDEAGYPPCRDVVPREHAKIFLKAERLTTLSCLLYVLFLLFCFVVICFRIVNSFFCNWHTLICLGFARAGRGDWIGLDGIGAAFEKSFFLWKFFYFFYFIKAVGVLSVSLFRFVLGDDIPAAAARCMSVCVFFLRKPSLISVLSVIFNCPIFSLVLHLLGRFG